ncbi:DUF1513 domain-containing protein [Paralimibaculum aggregatum]|uniref:DUF1513 domain-containing protein n=1 Tax=Paralimibaculum aggregatum TaxID=3036245 RepID=A0ABQ6LJF0_9RHOB|nr:DUF1513 domain-containing protein [Limibaculum sp. NKW23]GMG82370.1 DUF1513 domain-containing protein [Limibaculum sp. NKW23]
MPDRRHVLLGGLALAAAPATGWAEAGNPAYLAAARVGPEAHALFGIDAAGRDVFRVPLPGRGHAAAAHPLRPEAVALARRPGTYALVLDCRSGRVAARLTAPRGRHFQGHGAFSRDGSRLYTSENAYDLGTGRIGIWDAAGGYRRLGEVPSGGIGPHELLRLPGSDVLAVANGGILTHPDSGRAKLNLASMRPSLAYLSGDGDLLEQVELPPGLARNSIRHLAARGDGLIGFAMQWQGALGEPVPLLGLHRRGEAPRLLGLEPARQLRLRGYAGSVAFSGDGTGIAITAPRGGRAHVFAAESGSLAAEILRGDICGIAAGPAGFLATDGLGGVSRLSGADAAPLARHGDRNWDNHLVAL